MKEDGDKWADAFADFLAERITSAYRELLVWVWYGKKE